MGKQSEALASGVSVARTRRPNLQRSGTDGRIVTGMSFVRLLFNINDLVPVEVTGRRVRTIRSLVVVLLIATFPATFVAYQQERFQPLIEAVTQQIMESVLPDGAAP